MACGWSGDRRDVGLRLWRCAKLCSQLSHFSAPEGST